MNFVTYIYCYVKKIIRISVVTYEFCNINFELKTENGSLNKQKLSVRKRTKRTCSSMPTSSSPLEGPTLPLPGRTTSISSREKTSGKGPFWAPLPTVVPFPRAPFPYFPAPSANAGPPTHPPPRPDRLAGGVLTPRRGLDAIDSLDFLLLVLYPRPSSPLSTAIEDGGSPHAVPLPS
jgi:hypothetical protein